MTWIGLNYIVKILISVSKYLAYTSATLQQPEPWTEEVLMLQKFQSQQQEAKTRACLPFPLHKTTTFHQHSL